MRNCVLLSCLVVVLSACGAQAARASLHPALWTDADRYAAAIEDAYVAYEREVAEAEGVLYPTPETAHEASLALSTRRFDALLEVTLARRGLSTRGMALYGQYHPGFLAQQQEVYRERIAAVRRRAVDLAGRVDDRGSIAAAIHAEHVALR